MLPQAEATPERATGILVAWWMFTHSIKDQPDQVGRQRICLTVRAVCPLAHALTPMDSPQNRATTAVLAIRWPENLSRMAVVAMGEALGHAVILNRNLQVYPAIRRGRPALRRLASRSLRRTGD